VLLALLLLLAAGIRLWLLRHTEVAARDSIGFIRYALQLENQPLADVLRNNLQHPGYPGFVLAMSLPVRHALGGITPDSMRLSAQLASCLAAVLLVIPMYYLGRQLFHPAAGFWAAVLFQCLPVSCRALADAISESTFLLLVSTAMLCALSALRSRSWRRFALCGGLCGLAYLTRPEGVVVILAVGLVLLGTTAAAAWRQTLACGAALVVAAVAVAGPYAATIGHLTNKPTPQEILRLSHVASSTSGPLLASLFAEWAQGKDLGSRAWALRAFVTEVAKAYSYVLCVPALIGLWWFRDRLRAVPGAWVLLLVSLIQGLILWRMAARIGYVSERHVLLLVLCGLFWAAAAVWAFGHWLAARTPRLTAHGSGLAVVLLAAGAGLSLSQSLRPLHKNRAGFHAAGLWLAQHAHPADEIVDPFCWCHYYAGRVFQEGTTPVRPEGQPPLCYIVVERTEAETSRVKARKKLEELFSIHIDRAEHEHSRLPIVSEEAIHAVHGQMVYHWPEAVPEEQAKVLVYTVRPGP
jgi:4-amino-4-deoxy-L-arabinose transferase-like glycosyltransferase